MILIIIEKIIPVDDIMIARAIGTYSHTKICIVCDIVEINSIIITRRVEVNSYG
jgi:hypothetical protein